MKRIFHATDVHGSDYVWKKWVNVPSFHKADILILAGDLTGKAVVTIVKRNGHWTCTLSGVDYTLKNETELNDMNERIKFAGFYPYECDQARIDELKADRGKLDELFNTLMKERIREWLEFLISKVDTKNTTVVVNPGNDDEFVIDPVIREFEDRGIIYPLKKNVNLCYNYEMISLDYANPTPWNTPRECSEKELEKKIREEFDRVSDKSKAICNFHCPPKDTLLDLAPKLDKNMRPEVEFGGTYVYIHVGSEAVAKAFRKYEPFLGLHGHIHESFAADHVGRTLVLNPGSEYNAGVLRGYIMELDEHEITKWWKVEG